MNNANELRQMLRNYTGSEQVYRHSLARLFNYTEGARAFFRNAGQGAYWLADILATEPSIRKGVQEHGFCLALLDVAEGSAKLVVARDATTQRCTDGVKRHIFEGEVFSRTIDYTDCPEGIWKFYLTWEQTEKSEVVRCMLPSEY